MTWNQNGCAKEPKDHKFTKLNAQYSYELFLLHCTHECHKISAAVLADNLRTLVRVLPRLPPHLLLVALIRDALRANAPRILHHIAIVPR